MKTWEKISTSDSGLRRLDLSWSSGKQVSSVLSGTFCQESLPPLVWRKNCTVLEIVSKMSGSLGMKLTPLKVKKKDGEKLCLHWPSLTPESSHFQRLVSWSLSASTCYSQNKSFISEATLSCISVAYQWIPLN